MQMQNFSDKLMLLQSMLKKRYDIDRRRSSPMMAMMTAI